MATCVFSTKMYIASDKDADAIEKLYSDFKELLSLPALSVPDVSNIAHQRLRSEMDSVLYESVISYGLQFYLWKDPVKHTTEKDGDISTVVMIESLPDSGTEMPHQAILFIQHCLAHCAVKDNRVLLGWNLVDDHFDHSIDKDGYFLIFKDCVVERESISEWVARHIHSNQEWKSNRM